MSASNAKYEILVNILDRIVQDGVVETRRSIYRNASNSPEERDQARARAYIHLFLEARYGLDDFEERERQITESSYDGGIDAYHVDYQERQIILVQSKFRTNAQNFSEKNISISEVSRIDADRVLRGETTDEAGNQYSGHILGLQRNLQNIKDIARYSYKVVLLANVNPEERGAVTKILSDFETDVYDFQRCYDELVVPVLRGEQTYYSNLQFRIDMSNKSAGSRLSATIPTEYGPVDITVILAPTLEIARLMSRYRNSILRYNPRSYLEFRQQSTNRQIRESITNRKSGEFALLNNGITILSDETSVSERIGQKDAAQVALLNPQIINGGQTAFTLSRIYDEISDAERATLFEDKEVVVRIITLPDIDIKKKMTLIRDISSATNSQTQVVTADRVVVNEEQRNLAKRIFLEHGVLYEHKRGEYADAIQKGYVSRHSIVERALFLRLMFLACGEYVRATRSKSVKKGEGFKILTTVDATIIRFGDVLRAYREITGSGRMTFRRISEEMAMTMAVLTACDLNLLGKDASFKDYARSIVSIWPFIIDWMVNQRQGRDRSRLNSRYNSIANQWMRSASCPNDIRKYLENFGLASPPNIQESPEGGDA